jgi:hypothetical protein
MKSMAKGLGKRAHTSESTRPADANVHHFDTKEQSSALSSSIAIALPGGANVDIAIHTNITGVPNDQGAIWKEWSMTESVSNCGISFLQASTRHRSTKRM